MAYYPPDFLEQLLTRIDLVDVVAQHVELKRSGNNMFGLCPFHNEKSASFSVAIDKQMFYCFGCGKGGSAFQFLMDHDGYSFPEAVEYLAEKAGVPLPEVTPQQQQKSQQQARQRKEAGQLLQRVTDSLVKQLHQPHGAKALQYIRQRGLPQPLIERYQLGYTPAGYGFMTRSFAAAEHKELEAQGMLFAGDRGYVDRFRDRLMFPIYDQRGTVVGFGGRILGDGEPKYLNSPETSLFHKSSLLYGMFEHRDSIRQRKQLLIVEGYMDVLALAAHDLPIAVAPLGTAISEQQLQMAFRLCDAPVFCFDGDRAGYQAAWRALERMLPILRSEWTPRFLYLPEGEDPDSLLQREGGEAWMKRVAEATPALDAWLGGLRKEAGDGIEGKARMLKKAEKMLEGMSDTYLRQAWQQGVEERTGLQLQHAVATRRPIRPQKAQQTAVVRTLSNQVQERFMAGLLQNPLRFQELPEGACNFSLDDEGVRLLYNRALSLQGFEKYAGDACAAYLQRMFPEDNHIPRWINQDAVSDVEFSSITLDMLRAYLDYASLHTNDMGEKMRIRQRLTQVEAEQKLLSEKLETERRGSP
ncbi:MAG: DNA primase [Mariprofundaceae bacterium]|nr:DNA primase [Mariprofundaceae bacterium]